MFTVPERLCTNMNATSSCILIVIISKSGIPVKSSELWLNWVINQSLRHNVHEVLKLTSLVLHDMSSMWLCNNSVHCSVQVFKERKRNKNLSSRGG